MFFKKIALASALALSAGGAFACEINARVNIVGTNSPRSKLWVQVLRNAPALR